MQTTTPASAPLPRAYTNQETEAALAVGIAALVDLDKSLRAMSELVSNFVRQAAEQASADSQQGE